MSTQKPKSNIVIAVLMTCHNRCASTLKCLNNLYGQKSLDGVSLDIYLVDDGSTDGTGDAVRSTYPDIHVLDGNGRLYWSGGMRLAWAEAMKNDYDYYLWLNDDTTLFDDAVCTLLKTAEQIRQHGNAGIVVGSCRDPQTGEHTYGGRICKKTDTPITPTDQPQSCEFMNGNIVLVPHVVSEIVGNISPEFTHYHGDLDYGRRAIKQGFGIWVAPGYQGLCSTNILALWMDPKVPFYKRWRHLHSPKGLPPFEIYVYARRHYGFFWPLAFVKLFCRVLCPALYESLKQFVKS